VPETTPGRAAAATSSDGIGPFSAGGSCFMPETALDLSPLDIATFIGFLALVVGISLYASRKEDTSEDYFLAGRGLSWWLIGFSLIASNISTEHFVGMAGSAFGGEGLAIAHYEWVSSIAMVFIALVLLPLFLRCGLTTMPEFLEQRYSTGVRALMAVYTVVIYVAVLIAAVMFAGATAIKTLFDIDLVYGIWGIGLLAGAYTIYGGLKAVVWSDLLQGIALLAGGTVVMVLGFQKVGGVEAFFTANESKLHLMLPATHPELPWTTLLLGIWIPVTYYWGLNQFITQRTLASKSLQQGQLGLVFAAAIKVLLPFIIVFPGIMAFQLYGDQLGIENKDQAFPMLIKDLLPAGLRGILFAALLGAIMSSLDSMLNSASTILTVDIYQRYLNRDAQSRDTILFGRISTGAFVVIGGLVAMQLDRPNFEGVFKYIQEFQGFISPGVFAAFLFGLVHRRAPWFAGMAAMVLCGPLYGAMRYYNHRFEADVSFLNHMALTVLILIAVMWLLTAWRPRAEPIEFETRTRIDLTPSRAAAWLGGLVILAVVALYRVFW
jgi:solute:Na+ symporter, SSS family